MSSVFLTVIDLGGNLLLTSSSFTGCTGSVLLIKKENHKLQQSSLPWTNHNKVNLSSTASVSLFKPFLPLWRTETYFYLVGPGWVDVFYLL